MAIRDQIMADVKSAMKDKQQLKLDTLRFVQAAIKNREIELRPDPISEEEVITVFKKLVKQRKDSIEQYKAGNRPDLADNEAKELSILESYLPAQLSAEKIQEIVSEVIAELGAKTVKDMGNVMKAVQAKTQGMADNKLVSEAVRARLQQA